MKFHVRPKLRQHSVSNTALANTVYVNGVPINQKAACQRLYISLQCIMDLVLHFLNSRMKLADKSLTNNGLGCVARSKDGDTS